MTYGYAPKQHENIIARDPRQIVNQVFTAAIDLGQWTNPRNEITEAWAQVILNAAYEGTLRKSFLDGKKKVFLTLIGGGVFKNDIQWIFNAIDRMSGFIKDSGLEVTVICFTLGDHQVTIRPSLATLVYETGGTYKQYKNDGIYSFESKTLGVTDAKLGGFLKQQDFVDLYNNIVKNQTAKPQPYGNANVYKKFADKVISAHTTGMIKAFSDILILPSAEFNNLFTVDSIKTIAYQQKHFGGGNPFNFSGAHLIPEDESEYAQAPFVGTYQPLTGSKRMITRYSFFYSMLTVLDDAMKSFKGTPQENTLKQNLNTLYKNLQEALKSTTK